MIGLDAKAGDQPGLLAKGRLLLETLLKLLRFKKGQITFVQRDQLLGIVLVDRWFFSNEDFSEKRPAPAPT